MSENKKYAQHIWDQQELITSEKLNNIEKIVPSIIAPEYSADLNYVSGDYATCMGVLYKCKNNTTGNFNENDWEEAWITGKSEFEGQDEGWPNLTTDLLNKITEKGLNTFAPAFDASVANSVGDYVIYNGKLYHCITATSGAFDSSDWEMVLVGEEFNRVDGEVSDLKSAINTAIRGLGQNLNSTTGATICSNDLNNLPRNTVYGLVPYSELANMPYADTDSNGGIVMTLSKESAVNATMTQIIVRRNGKIYMRQYWGSGYESWREYNTAAEIENEFNYVRDAISYITGYAPIPLKELTQIATGTSTGVVYAPNQVVSNDTDSLLENCSPGDVFLITATGFTSYRTYCFYDSSNTILSMSTAAEALNKRTITAPANAAKIVVNAKRASSPRYVYKLSTGLMDHTEFAPTGQNIISDTVSGICSGNANNIPNNNIYGILISSSEISNMPPFPDGGSGTYQGTFITFGKESSHGYGDVQIYVKAGNGGSTFVRNYTSAWTSWKEYADYSVITSDITSLYSTVTTDISNAVSPVATDVAALKAKIYFSPTSQNIISDTVFSICSGDANNIPNNNIYGISIASSAISHMPPFPEGTSGTYKGTFITFGKETARGYGDVQVYVKAGSGASTYVRNYTSDWTDWKEYAAYSVITSDISSLYSIVTSDISDAVSPVATDVATLMAKTYFSPTAQNITSDTVSGICSGDADNIPNNNIYGISIDYSLLTHMPSYPAGVNGTYQGTIFSFGKQNARGYGDVQIYVQRASNCGVFVRNYTSSWGTWKNLTVLMAVKVLGIGDSICEGWRNNNMGFAGMLGLPYRNLGVSGATLGQKASHTQICDEIENETITEDMVIANGGINDYYFEVPLGTMSTHPAVNDTQAAALDKSTLSGGLEYLLYLIIKKAPKAQRYFLITHKTRNYPYTPCYSGGYTQQEMHDRIVAICKLYNTKVIDVYEESVINSEFDAYISPTAYSNSNKGITKQYYVDADRIHPLWLGYQAGYLPVMLRTIQSAVMT